MTESRQPLTFCDYQLKLERYREVLADPVHRGGPDVPADAHSDAHCNEQWEGCVGFDMAHSETLSDLTQATQLECF